MSTTIWRRRYTSHFHFNIFKPKHIQGEVLLFGFYYKVYVNGYFKYLSLTKPRKI